MTPLPWKLKVTNRQDGESLMYTGDDSSDADVIIAEIAGGLGYTHSEDACMESLANAVYIHTAVHAHETLVRALDTFPCPPTDIATEDGLQAFYDACTQWREEQLVAALATVEGIEREVRVANGLS